MNAAAFEISAAACDWLRGFNRYKAPSHLWSENNDIIYKCKKVSFKF